LRYHRTTGLTSSQARELTARVNRMIGIPWQKSRGRRRACGLYKAVEITCLYLRQNMPQELIGDLHGISQPVVSRVVKMLTPLVKSALAEFVPSEKEACKRVKGKVVLVDGTLTPSWSYAGRKELWNKKHATTGFNVQLVCLTNGNPVWISGPLPGKVHDAQAYRTSGAERIVNKSSGGIGDKGYQGTGLVTPRKKQKGRRLNKYDKECNTHLSSIRAPVERVVAHFKNWRVLHSDYRRPYETYRDSFDAARGLFFFSINWNFE
jgi:hypothetical protein